jgi:hypothetical protein
MNVRSWAWSLTFAIVMAFAIPWFLWGSTRVVAGLPLWLWWHIGWMALAAVVFWVFSRRAWGLGITSDTTTFSTGSEYQGENR